VREGEKRFEGGIEEERILSECDWKNKPLRKENERCLKRHLPY
jgi:hypothetical protein